MTAGTAVAVTSISPRNGERPMLDVPAAKMLDGFPRRVLASRLATRCLSQHSRVFIGPSRYAPTWSGSRRLVGPVSDQLRPGVGPPGRSDRRPASWAVHRLDLAG
jgi:hypothetical protein